MLNVISHGSATDSPPIVIAHGLFGSGRNWGVIAKRLSDTRQVIAVDMRNHGKSPWSDSHTYLDLADDLAQVISGYGGIADVIGHSMGGKAAMTLALKHRDKVARLVIADIAPVNYQHSQQQYIDAMRAVDLRQVSRRSDAEKQLETLGVDKELQSFFTQSLDIPGKTWTLNLDSLERNMPQIMNFPDIESEWIGPALFLSGAASDYVTAAHRPTIKSLFPKARFAKLPGVGHWLHAEDPRGFEAAMRVFLNADKSG